jgi:quercetin dioxygenase-like cupin family protein
MNLEHCIAWDDVPETVTSSGLAKRVIEGAGAALVMVKVPGGLKGERHSHRHEQFVQVVSGGGTLETAQGVTAFGAGSVFHFPADAWHKASFDTDTVLIETNLTPEG